MRGQIVRQEYELTCVAPVHTGSGEKLRAFEYLYDRQKQEVYFLNESKWIALLAQEGLMDAFAEAIGHGAFRAQSLWEWLRAQGIKEGAIRALALRRAQAATLTADQRAKKTLNDIVCQTAHTDGRPYIPGSTIKGALRTGLLYTAIKRDPARFRPFWQRICAEKGNLKDRKKAWESTIKELETTALHTLALPGVKESAVLSCALRGLRVSDAALRGAAETVVLQKVDATTKPKRAGGNESRISLFRECIPAGRKLHFSITADLAMLRTAGIETLDQVVVALRAYTADGLRMQEAAFDGQFYRPLFAKAREADALLGGGTGFLTKTLVYALANSEVEARAFIAAYLDEVFAAWNPRTRQKEPTHAHRQFDRTLSPRTLKRAVMGQDDWIMGLCSIRRVGNAQTI